MQNLFLLYGNDIDEISSYVDLSVQKKVQDNEIKDLKIYRIDNQDELEEFYDHEATISLFTNQSILKLYISQKGLKYIEKDAEAFVNKVQFLSRSKTVYLIMMFTKYDKAVKLAIQKSDLFASFKKFTELKEFTKLKSWQKGELKNKIQNHIKELNLTISSDALELMQDALRESSLNIVQELNKIKTYIMPETNISKEVVYDFYLTHYNVDDLYDYLLFKKLKLSDLQVGLGDIGAPLYVLAILQGKFRESYKIKICLKEGIAKQEIAKMLGIHPYRLDLTIAKIKNIEIDYLQNIILQLSELEYKLKTGRIDSATALDRMLLLQ